jgi:hypothetical protein
VSITIKRTGTAVHVLEGAHTLPDGTPVQLFTGQELQMPSFIRGDEDEDAEELFYLQPQPTTPE